MPLLKRLFALSALFFLFSAQFAYAEGIDVVKLMQTGQIVSSTDPVVSGGDDGALKKGLHWSASTRFIDNKDGTVTDTMTGLMWQADGDLPVTTGYKKATATGLVNWVNALDLINQINSGTLTQYNMGYTDWRLPNIIELESITTAGTSCADMLNNNGFNGVYPEAYATSTTFAGNTNRTFYNLLICGKIVNVDKSMGLRVMAVRGDTSGQGAIWKTGQTVSYKPGDDGALEKGVTWPDPRFVSLGDGTVADRLTNLIWLQDAGTPPHGSYTSRGIKTWTEALDYVAQMNQGNYLGHTDWRLPNRRELVSLMDYSHYAPALTPGNGFTNVRFVNNTSIKKRSPNFYWTSTSHESLKNEAFYVDPYDGEYGLSYKVPYTDSNGSHAAPKFFVWPVCGDSTAAPLQIPASRITSPINGAYMPGPLGTYSITGKADEISGTIAGVSVSTDGGKTWDSALDTSGDGSWSTWQYSWKPSGPGAYTIQSKAVDSNGKEEYPGPGIKVYAGVYTLSVSGSPSSGGNAALSPSGGTYNEGTKVTITATAAKGFVFTGWSGDVTGTQNPAQVTVDSNMNVVANFASPQYGLTVNVAPQGGGAVKVSPAGPYGPGQVVSLTATAADGYLFAGWNGDVADKTSASTTVTMNAADTVTANFAEINGLDFSINQTGQSVRMNAQLTDDNPARRIVSFMLSSDGGKTWALKARAVTNTTGACAITRSLGIGPHQIMATCKSASGQVYQSAALDLNVARVQALSPANGAVVTDPTPTVSWAAMPGATGYEIKTVIGRTVLAPVSVDGNTTSAALPALTKGQKAVWSVTALLPTGRSLTSIPRAVIYREATTVTVDPGLSGRYITPVATLSGADSGPLSRKAVTFFLKNVAGKTSTLGRAVTDTTGTAHLAKRAITAGSYTIKASFAGTAVLSGSTANVDFAVQ